MADTEQPPGASPEVAVPASAPGTVTPLPASPVTPTEKVDLTAIPAFREYQSAQDKKEAAAQRALLEQRAQLSAVQAQLEQLAAERKQAELAQLETLDPVEQVAALKKRMSAQEAQQRAEAEKAQIAKEASDLMAASGIAPNDPRLQQIWNMGATREAIAALARALPTITRQDAAAETAALKAELESLKRSQPEKAKTDTQKAVVAALNQAGVTATSSAPSAIAPVGAEEGQMQALREKYNRNKGKGVDNPAIADIERELRKMGKTTADLFTR